MVTSKYMNGAEANTKAENKRTFRLPKVSEREAAGRLMRMPGMVEADATTPSKFSGVPKLVAKGFRTGLFDMVELKMAKAPITQSIGKKRSWKALFLNCIVSQLSTNAVKDLF